MSASSVSRLLWDEVGVVSASDSDLRIWDLDLTIKADRAVILLGRFGCRESACVPVELNQSHNRLPFESAPFTHMHGESWMNYSWVVKSA